MKIQYCSDLHLEFAANSRYLEKKPLKVNGDILILAGDIIPLHDEFFNNPFFSFISDNYKKTFWVPGNHEFYYSDLAEYNPSFTITIRNNIQIVHNIEQEYENIRFIFSTLWSNISKRNEKIIEQSISDFSCISKLGRKIRAFDFNELHQKSLNFIEQSLETKVGKTIVVTHHLPSHLCNSPEYKNSRINEAFCTDLTERVTESQANFWIYGHSHFNQKPVFLGDTILLTNQLGYVDLNEQEGFKHNAYLSI
jgi:Icc-related predicted phosphoesterase